MMEGQRTVMMKKFSEEFIDPAYYRNNPRKPDFNNILAVLENRRPSRPTLFEYYMNNTLTEQVAPGETDPVLRNILTFQNCGYDYVTANISEFGFPTGKEDNHGASSRSLNDSAVSDREGLESYPWMEVEDCDFSALDEYGRLMPEGMKLMVSGPNGILENVIRIVGYDNLCYMLMDDPELCREVFEGVGSRTFKYYEKCIPHPAVGIVMCNDDWGFNTQTMLAPQHLREYVFPWYKKIAELAHQYGKPVALHSCGRLTAIMDDIIDDIKIDGKHSYEDGILPVEQAYDLYGDRLAILGGLDLNFLCQSIPEQVYERACAMLMHTSEKGGYGLGSGNSIPEYVPLPNYYAMIAAANFNNWD